MKRVAGLAAALAFLVPSHAHASFPGRDGRIAMVDAAGLLSTAPDGRHERRLFDSPYAGNPSFSPDGRSLLFSDNRNIFIARPNGARRRRVKLPFRYVQSPDWLPGGHRFTFFRIVPDQCGYFCVGESFSRQFWSARADGSHLRRVGRKLPQADDDLVPLPPSPSGRFRAQLHFGDGGGDGACAHVDLVVKGRRHTARHRVSVPTALQHNCVGGGVRDWSPNERRLAIALAYADPTCACPPDELLFTVRRDGTHLHAVTDWLAGIGRVVWSPSGSRIAFAVDWGRPQWGVYVASAVRAGPSRLIAARASSPSWQPLPRRR
jgi:dipeptidyl aminopeptidase/acylaminoacyl peptidase